MSLVGGVIVALVFRFPTRRAWRRGAWNQAAAVLTTVAGKACLGPRTVEVGPDGIAITSAFARTLFNWRGVIDVIPTPDPLIVILPGSLCLCVPRRACDTDSDFERFEEAVTELATAGGGLTGRNPPS